MTAATRPKWSGFLLRAGHAFRWLPLRASRLAGHVKSFRFSGTWWLELLYLFLDLLAAPELYETAAECLKWKTRPLTPEELSIVREVFGDSLPYDRIRIDEKAYLGPPQWRICYVSFFTINAWGRMPPDVLVHEVMHVWQFHRMGSVYIPRALSAQRSKEGYDYGGGQRIGTRAASAGKLDDFNLEQQADLIADYWRIRHGRPPVWGNAAWKDAGPYLHFVQQLHHPAR
jgi:hypothetical protein